MYIPLSAAAKATLYRKETPDQTWDWITEMFNAADEKRYCEKSFIPGGYPLDKVDGLSKGCMAGSIYKYNTMNSGPYYVTVRSAANNRHLEYSSELKPTQAGQMSNGDKGINITRFTVEPHPEGTTLIIERVESGYVSLFSYILGLLGIAFNKNAVVGRLVFMINGSGFPSGSTYVSGSLRVERDDRLIKNLLN